MQEFLTYLQSEKAPVPGRIGAIVMNCNPFTLGHRYLVESARKEVDFLYLFCVEEDKSEFSFADRIRLMRMGVDDLKNVKVLRSGEFVLSSATFPEYFGKSVLPDVTVDASLDVEIFARQIAPALDISVRFAGSEPNCPITRQYNAAMREVLPGYGIEVVVFDRMEAGGAPVSASTVRRLLKDGDFDAIRGLVPSSTLQYLLERREIERRI